MPELPEVEIIRAGLSQLLPGLRIEAIDFDWPKSFPNSDEDVQTFLLNAEIKAVGRRAKVLIIDLSSDYSLVIHLKMTGQLVFRSPKADFGAGHPTGSLVGELPDKSTRVTLTLSGGAKLFFNDQRKFGWMRLIPTLQVDNLDFFRKIGPEPLSTDFDWQDLYKQLQKMANTTIKAALLDQTVIAGIGNIYADESLWGAKIHPDTVVKKLSKQRVRTLYEELVFVLELAIEKGGSTDRNYVNAEGRKGSYLSFARVFRREGQPCPRHPDTMIQKIRVAGRGTHLCPRCQKLPK